MQINADRTKKWLWGSRMVSFSVLFAILHIVIPIFSIHQFTIFIFIIVMIAMAEFKF